MITASIQPSKSHDRPRTTPPFSDNGYSKDSSYPMDSKTLLGHTFPKADLLHCDWLPLRDLAYRESRIASFGDFSLLIRLSVDLMISTLRCNASIPVSGSCIHEIVVMVTFILPVRIARCGK
jgi:hypothetical protein